MRTFFLFSLFVMTSPEQQSVDVYTAGRSDRPTAKFPCNSESLLTVSSQYATYQRIFVSVTLTVNNMQAYFSGRVLSLETLQSRMQYLDRSRIGST